MIRITSRTLSLTLMLTSLLLTACGGGSSSSSNNTNNSGNTQPLSLPSVTSNTHTQSFNLGHTTSSAFSNTQGFQVSYGGLTQTLQKSATDNSWTIIWDGTYDGETFNNWVAFGYEDTPNHAQQIGRFYQNHYNQTQVSAELFYYQNGQISFYSYLEDGTLDSTAVYVPRNNLGPRVITKSGTSVESGIIDLADAAGTSGVIYSGCTASLDTLKTDTSSCTTSVAF